MLTLTKIQLQNFGGFGQFEVEVGDLTVLVGSNNGGKTTLLRALEFAVSANELALGPYKNARKHWENNNAGTIAARTRNPSVPHAILPPVPRMVVDPKAVSNRLGISDPAQLLHLNGRLGPMSITLVFQAGLNNIRVHIKGVSNGLDVEVFKDTNSLTASQEPPEWKIIDEVLGYRIDFVPALATLVQAELLLTWPQIVERTNVGKRHEVWRNRLHWLNDGQDPEAFNRVIRRIGNYLEGIEVRPPSRSKDGQPRAVLNYRENGESFDIAMSGDGLRNLLAVVAYVEISDANLLVFDEPDAHIHSSVVRKIAEHLVSQSNIQRQIIVATHSPDLIEEVPLESMVWVDKAEVRGQRCDDVGRTLVSLGAIGRVQAMQTIGGHAILYFENKPDRQVFTALMLRCGAEEVVKKCRLADLKGAGDIKHLPNAARVLRNILPQKVSMAVIRDCDYISANPKLSIVTEHEVMVITLPCKELENLLLMQPNAIHDAIKDAAANRANQTGREVKHPLCEDIAIKIDELTAEKTIREELRLNWIANRMAEETSKPDAGVLKKLEEEFERRWGDPLWRRRCTAGKKVLSRLKQWLQQNFNLSLGGYKQLFSAYKPDADLEQAFRQLESHVNATSI